MIPRVISRASRAALLSAASLALIGLIGVVDHDTGPDLSVVLFYVLPVFLAAWYVGRRAGLAAALAATLVWYLANWLPHSWTFRVGWNLAEKVGFFSLSALLVDRLKRSAVAVYERDLEIGRDVQRGLFLQSPPEVAGLEVAARLIPNRSLSGDYYDFFPRDGGLDLVVADVMGKGLAASLLTANLHALLHFNEIQASPAPPADLLESIHRHLRRHSPNRYVTLAQASIDAGAGRVRYVVAGHPPPLLWAGAGVVRLEATGPPVGLLPECGWTTGERAFPPGALLVAYSDGVTEAVDAEGRELGLERLEECLETLGRAGAPAEVAADELLASLRAWTGDVDWPDDVSLVVVRNASGVP